MLQSWARVIQSSFSNRASFDCPKSAISQLMMPTGPLFVLHLYSTLTFKMVLIAC